jgi:thymidylate kinase
VILGPDGAGKSAVIAGLVERLSQAGRAVRTRHLKPRIIAELRRQPVNIVVDPHGMPARGTCLSLVKILVWLVEEWWARFSREDVGTLLLCDRYYHDLLVDPKRYRFGAPLWTANLIGKLMPQPKLWILLDAPAEVVQVRKREVPLEETRRQCGAYRSFIRMRRDHAIVDASRPLHQVLADAARAIDEVIGKYEDRRE